MTHATNLLRFTIAWSLLIFVGGFNIAAYVAWLLYVVFCGQRISVWSV